MIVGITHSLVVERSQLKSLACLCRVELRCKFSLIREVLAIHPIFTLGWSLPPKGDKQRLSLESKKKSICILSIGPTCWAVKPARPWLAGWRWLAGWLAGGCTPASQALKGRRRTEGEGEI